jgi:hypothetical protein
VDPSSLTITLSGSDVIVGFDDSLVPAAADHFNIYRGTLPSAFDSHDQLMGGCAVAGPAFRDDSAATSGQNLYYLVVAACMQAGSDDLEGSYGRDSGGDARRVALTLCP